MPRARTAAAGYDDESEETGLRAALARAFGGNPVDSIALFVAVLAAVAVLVNALYLQPGPHPAPIFTIKPRPVVSTEPAPAPASARPGDPISALLGEPPAARPRAAVVMDIQRELARRGLFDGPPDGVLGPKTDAAIRDFVQAAGQKTGAEPSEELLRAIASSSVRKPAAATPAPTGRSDPIAQLIAPSARVLAVQRALSDYGYGPLKATGLYGPETVKAIEKFERDRKLPVSGQISPRLLRELAAVTGRPLE